MDEELFIELQRLFKLMHDRGIRELAITQPEFSMRATAMETGAVIVMPMPGVTAPSVAAAPEAPPAPSGHVIASPLVGTFYRTPSPDAPAFVEVGDMVETGQTVAIVEAMKVFNEITSDVTGRVIAIPAVNGKLVQVDQPLVIIEPL
ncbi:MAG: Biotin carboxyl carrier protein of acetyl-CoA carboxylase [bacterium ADurb.Bin429]|nr:MAG: Biotin carboxyl carrier protein of acetyl-CoA carboxylase [bacterium ADurb.Bin429]